MNTKIALCMTAYRRPKTFNKGLSCLIDNTIKSNIIDIDLYINTIGTSNFPEVYDVAAKHEETLDFMVKYDMIGSYKIYNYAKNVGKPFALNYIIDKHSFDYMLTIDQDIFIYGDYVGIIEDVLAQTVRIKDRNRPLSFDVLGFSSKNEWIQYPDKENCFYFNFVNEEYRIYYPISIAGGMMMVSREHLNQNKWRLPKEGVYGGDDVQMSASTNKKIVIEPQKFEWMVHDPDPEEDNYLKLKTDLVTKNNIFETSLQEGWDNNT